MEQCLVCSSPSVERLGAISIHKRFWNSVTLQGEIQSQAGLRGHDQQALGYLMSCGNSGGVAYWANTWPRSRLVVEKRLTSNIGDRGGRARNGFMSAKLKATDDVGKK